MLSPTGSSVHSQVSSRLALPVPALNRGIDSRCLRDWSQRPASARKSLPSRSSEIL